MDTEDIKLSIKRVFTDRPFLWMIAGVALAGIIYMLLVGFNIRPSDVTVYIRFTRFGQNGFYGFSKSHWAYHFSFLVFGLVVAVTHIALMIKFHNLDRRQTALFVGWTGVAVLIISAAYALAVMNLGRIS